MGGRGRAGWFPKAGGALRFLGEQFGGFHGEEGGGAGRPQGEGRGGAGLQEWCGDIEHVDTRSPAYHLMYEKLAIHDFGSVRLSVFPSFCQSVCLSTCLSVSLSVCLFVCPSVYLFICLSI